MRPADAKPVPPGREDEVAELLDAVRHWAARRADLRAVALVGSWARGKPHADSDVDIVLLADTPETYIDDDKWARRFGAVEVVRTQRWGILTERRMLVGGLLVALHDPSGLLSGLVAAVAAQRT